MGTVAEKPRRRRREKLRGDTCLNCKADIETPFCPQCGQENVPADLSLTAVIREFLSEIAYFESKLWRTLRALVAHPGSLSAAWAQGRRTSYLSPVRLYLGVTFLFFVGTALHSHTGIGFNAQASNHDKLEMIQDTSREHLTEVDRQLLESRKAELNLSPELDRKYEAALDRAVKNKAAENGKGISVSGADLGALGSLKDRTGWIGRQVNNMEAAVSRDQYAFAQQYVEEIPKALFVILPLCALVLKFLYWRQRRTFVEHLVFLLHFHSFAFLLLLPTDVFSGRLISALTVFSIFIWIPGYAFVAMLRFYGQPWWLTLLKSWLLGFAYLILASFGALLALVFLVASLPNAPANDKATAPPAHALGSELNSR